MNPNLKSELTKALLACGFFLLMAVLNAVAEWDKSNAIKDQWREELFLNVSQEKLIAGIDQEFYLELANAYSVSYPNEDEFCMAIKKITAAHNQKIENALNSEQRKKFQTFISCHNLP
jgi:hypothetical protein